MQKLRDLGQLFSGVFLPFALMSKRYTCIVYIQLHCMVFGTFGPNKVSITSLPEYVCARKLFLEIFFSPDVSVGISQSANFPLSFQTGQAYACESGESDFSARAHTDFQSLIIIHHATIKFERHIDRSWLSIKSQRPSQGDPLMLSVTSAIVSLIALFCRAFGSSMLRFSGF